MPLNIAALARKSFGLLFGGIWLVVGLPFLIIGLYTAFQEYTFEKDAQTTDGIVLTKYIKRASKNNSTQYRVTYRFNDSRGETVEGDSQVDVDEWERLTERGPIRVTYAAGHPRSNRLGNDADWTLPLVFGLLGSVFTIAGGIIFFKSLNGVLTARRLDRDGIPCEASITDVGPTNVSINRRPQWRVHYEYRDMMGQVHTGKSGYLSETEANQWRTGQSAQIKYDQNRPAKSIWIGNI